LPVFGSAYSPDRKPDTYSTLGLGGELNHQISDRIGAYVGGDYRGRAYKTYCDNTCNYSLDVRGGVSYSGGAWLARAGVNAGSYDLNKKTYRNTLGLTADWRLALANGSQLSAGASTSRASYLDTTTIDQNSQTNTLTVGWLTPLGDGSSIFSISASGGVEMAVGGRSDGDKRFSGPRLLFQTSFTDKLGGYITSGSTSSRYTGINAYYGVPREETLVDMALGLTWTIGKGLSLRPQLSALRNTSNAELYSYDKTDASVNLRLDF